MTPFAGYRDTLAALSAARESLDVLTAYVGWVGFGLAIGLFGLAAGISLTLWTLRRIEAKVDQIKDGR